MIYRDLQEYEEIHLQTEFNRIKKRGINKNNIDDIQIIYEIIEQIPSQENLEEIIFANRKYNLLLRHDALIKAIELKYNELVIDVVTKSLNFELIKTAINAIDNDELLKLIATGLYSKNTSTKKNEIAELALKNIQDSKIFEEAFHKLFSIPLIMQLYQKIKYKSHYRSLSKLQKRMLPIIVSYLSPDEIVREFQKNKKYPLQVRKPILRKVMRPSLVNVESSLTNYSN